MIKATKTTNTHDIAYRNYGDKIIYIEDGRVINTEFNFPESEIELVS